MYAAIFNNKGECQRIIRDITHIKHIRLDDGKQVIRFFCHDKSKHTFKMHHGTFVVYEDIKPEG